jgi:hypothetical protein
MALKISSAFDFTEILILQSTQELSERPVDNFGISAQLPSKFSSPRSPITQNERASDQHHTPPTHEAPSFRAGRQPVKVPVEIRKTPA